MTTDPIKLQRDLAVVELERNKALTQEIVIDYETRLEHLNRQNQQTQELLDNERVQHGRLRADVQNIIHSQSWRITRPLRLVKRVVSITIRRRPN